MRNIMKKDRGHDYWVWSEPIMDIDNVKLIQNAINERYAFFEPKDNGATDKHGNYLKNIKPKVVILRDINQEIGWVIDLAYKICHTQFGYMTFPPNIFNELLYNEYSSDIKGRYGKHLDSSDSDIYDVKMTFLLNLSDEPYEGGDFIVGEEVTNFRKPGSALLFKSHILHEVTPVTKGTRRTLAYFIDGPKAKIIE